MPKRNTDTLYLRVDPDLNRLVRRFCDERQVALSHLAELALREFIARTSTDQERENYLSRVEEALLKRLDGRIGDLVKRMGDLHARHAFDQAEGLFITKSIALLQVRDRQEFTKILKSAREDAAKRLQQRVDLSAGLEAAHRQEMEKAQGEVEEAREVARTQIRAAEQAEKQIADLTERLQLRQDQMAELQQVADYESRRADWAGKQLEAQGVLRRKSYAEWQAEYDLRHRSAQAR